MPVRIAAQTRGPSRRAAEARSRSTLGQYRSPAAAGSRGRTAARSVPPGSGARSSSRWHPPGATRTRPAATRSPSAASATASREVRASRSAKARVKRAGMCCATRMPSGRSPGKAARISWSARGPPVEAPITATRGGSTSAAIRAGGRSRAAIGSRFSIRSARTTSSLASSSPRTAESPPSSGLATKSSAPNSSDLKTSPRREAPERTTTGVGWRSMRSRRKVKPSIRGIWRSRRMASGASASACRSASSPSPA